MMRAIWRRWFYFRISCIPAGAPQVRETQQNRPAVLERDVFLLAVIGVVKMPPFDYFPDELPCLSEEEDGSLHLSYVCALRRAATKMSKGCEGYYSRTPGTQQWCAGATCELDLESTSTYSQNSTIISILY